MKKTLLTLLIAILSAGASATSISDVWVSDLGNGQFKNPVIYADYSDPDVCKVGDAYIMTASSFNCVPGLPLLRSYDLVNWELIGYALNKLQPEDHFALPQHGGGVWAPSIRYNNKKLYIYWGDPDFGIYMISASQVEGPWSEPILVKAGKGLIDPSPLWDSNGKAYLSFALAGSRAGLKSVLLVAEMHPEGTHLLSDARIVFDGHKEHETIEGTKFYKRNGYYYILAPAGGVATGWQVALRAKNPFGPFEIKTVMHQGSTHINGPHQGGWVHTDAGEDWFLHFQDVGVVGRIVHLNPVKWIEDWPVMGNAPKDSFTGVPLRTADKPKVVRTVDVVTPPENDEFTAAQMGVQWQWHANPSHTYAYYNPLDGGWLRLYSVPKPDAYVSLWSIPNLYLQKLPAPVFTATTKLRFEPNTGIQGERAGFVLMGRSYAMISIEQTSAGLVVSQIACERADRGGKETVHASEPLNQNDLYIRMRFTNGEKAQFSYSLDGTDFVEFGPVFQALEGQWIGAKMGFFCSREEKSNDGGWLDVDWIRITP